MLWQSSLTHDWAPPTTRTQEVVEKLFIEELGCLLHKELAFSSVVSELSPKVCGFESID
jgi:hypothetical protein